MKKKKKKKKKIEISLSVYCYPMNSYTYTFAVHSGSCDFFFSFFCITFYSLITVIEFLYNNKLLYV